MSYPFKKMTKQKEKFVPYHENNYSAFMDKKGTVIFVSKEGINGYVAEHNLRKLSAEEVRAWKLQKNEKVA